MALIGFNERLHVDPLVDWIGTEALGLWVMSVGYVVRHGADEYPLAEALFTDSQGRLTPVLVGTGFWGEAMDLGYPVLSPILSNGQPAFRVLVPKTEIPPPIRRQVFARDGRICRLCGATEDLTLDHIWPQVLGGEHTLENLRVLCRSCNSSKGARVGGP